MLLVVPTSVITNWQREFSTWGAFSVAIFHGDKDRRSAALEGIRGGQAEILITSYDTCRSGCPSLQPGSRLEDVPRGGGVYLPMSEG